jgi:hypothetical protein
MELIGRMPPPCINYSQKEYRRFMTLLLTTWKFFLMGI